jgi:hypothetical protein
MFCTSCGGSSSSSSSSSEITIAISPTSVTLAINTSQQFSTTVTNTSTTDVTWQVNGTTGGNSTYGTITTAGLYTAPGAVPATAVTVTAISKADTTKTASATVSLTNSNTLSVSPTLATVGAGGQQTFSALLGDKITDANWSLSCPSIVIGACGTITPAGVYTAPLSPPPGQEVSVIASSRSNNANTANARVTVTLAVGSLYGRYAFSLAGTDSLQSFSEAGSIGFDGKGNIVGGTLDRNGQTQTVTITGGTYTCDDQGRVAVQLQTTAGTESWRMVLVNHSRAFAILSDLVVARGELELQDSTQFGGILGGSFSIRLAGSSVGKSLSNAGALGAANIDALGVITSGVLDVNDGGAISTNLTLSGAVTASASDSGRGTLTLASAFGSQTFAYYLVDAYTAKLIEIDGIHDYSGKLSKRTASTSVTANDFQGTFGFVFSGTNSDGAVGHGGTFLVSSGGGISNGTFDTTTDDAYSLGNLFSGSVTVTDSTTGRCIVSMNINGTLLQFVEYPPDFNYEFPFLEIDGKNLTSGVAIRTGSSTLGALPSASGEFAFSIGEVNNTIQKVAIGTIALPTPSGILDSNDGGTVTLGSSLQFGAFSVTSWYGRSQLQFQAGNIKPSFTAYIVDANTVLLLETDGKGVLTGIARERY